MIEMLAKLPHSMQLRWLSPFIILGFSCVLHCCHRCSPYPFCSPLTSPAPTVNNFQNADRSQPEGLEGSLPKGFLWLSRSFLNPHPEPPRKGRESVRSNP